MTPDDNQAGFDRTDAEARERAVAGLIARLQASGALDEGALDRVRALSAETGERPERVLVKLGLALETAVAEAFADQSGLPLAGVADWPSAPIELGDIRLDFLRASMVAPLRAENGEALIGVADPFESFAPNALADALGLAPRLVVATPSDIRACLERLYGDGARARRGGGAAVRGGARLEEDVERLRDLASEEPVIRLVNDLIDAALGAGASDLHLEPEADRLRARLRVDGVLRDHRELPLAQARAAISRLKIMARLDIAETRLPQDGRIRATARGREIDLRVSTLPAIHGEAAALRLLDVGGGRPALDGLGLPQAEEQRLRAMLARPSGVILVTGPTGSGKTTTLYAALAELATEQTKILTVEDPVEYRLPRAIQVQVKPEIGLTFAGALRSFLRHDPDVIMVGEIRDRETAEIAVQAALTGHLVLSTLHTNSAIGALPRLREMGLESYLLGAAVSGLVAQRLVRRLCGQCKRPAPPGAAAAAGFAAPAHWEFHEPQGCSACGGSGYRGRLAAIEAVAIDEHMRRRIGAGAEAGEIEDAARAEGMASLAENALRLAAAGETSLAEVARIGREA